MIPQFGLMDAFAVTMYEMYVSLVDSGFTKKQAMRVVEACIAANGYQQRDDK